MIRIEGAAIQDIYGAGLSQYARMILNEKQASPREYVYSSKAELLFELALRAEIMHAAEALAHSAVSFAVFRDARCNPQFWMLTPRGAFALRPGVRPSAAIRDIFLQGHLYAFECAVAIVMVLYKAVAEMLGDEVFDTLFSNLLLFSWNMDSDLKLVRERGGESFPGDILYFMNPDVSPLTPEYQGLNVVRIGHDLYYGHDIGVTSSAHIITALNQHRRPGSMRSAYLMDETIYPDFNDLRRHTAYRDEEGASQRLRRLAHHRWQARIGARLWIESSGLGS